MLHCLPWHNRTLVCIVSSIHSFVNSLRYILSFLLRSQVLLCRRHQKAEQEHCAAVRLTSSLLSVSVTMVSATGSYSDVVSSAFPQPASVIHTSARKRKSQFFFHVNYPLVFYSVLLHGRSGVQEKQKCKKIKIILEKHILKAIL